MNKNLEKSRSSFKSSPNFLVGFFALKRHSFKKHFLKPVSLVLVFTFSYTQILWAADARQMLLDAKASFEDDTRRGGTMTATDLEAAQSAQAAAIDQQAALQDLQNMNFSLTTKNGDILKYVGDTLNEVQRPDGTTLKNVQVDANGNILNADLKLSDGSIQVYQNGQVIGYQTPDGTSVEYDIQTGRVLKTISAKGLISDYSYETASSGNTTKTIVTSTNATATYDSTGTLEKLETSDGITTFFSQGKILKVLKGGYEYLYQSQPLSNGNTKLTLALPGDANSDGIVDAGDYTSWADQYGKTGPGLTGDFNHDGIVDAADYTVWADHYRPALNSPQHPKELIYTPDNKLKEALLPDNTRLSFENGLLKEARDSGGNLTSFSFSESFLGNLTNTTIVQNGLDSSYDSEGKLKSVKIDDLTIHYKSDETTIDFIEKTDGTELYDLVFDANGNIQGASIYTPEGEIRTYENGKLVNLRKPDTTELFYLDDKPLTLITPEKLSYHFDYTFSPDVILATLDPLNVPDSLTAIKMQYDTNFNLKQVIRQNQEILNYSTNGSLASIGYTDTSKALQVFHYQADGKTIDYIEQGSVATYYDANNQPTSSIISPTTDNPHTLDVVYQYGKIREIYKSPPQDGSADASVAERVLTFKYTYTFGPNSEELTHIEDLEEKTSKVYQSGNLLTSLDNEMSVLSTYEYEPVILSGSEGSQSGDSSASPQNDARVSKVTVTRLGRTLHTYTYSYDQNNTLVTDEEGVKRTYSENKLRYLEKDKQKFQYAYFTNTDGEEIVEEKLIEKKLSDDSIAHYDNGKVTKIDLSDGAFITDIVLDGNRLIQKATLNLTDGARLTFTNNELTEVMDASGRQLEYSYDKNTDGSIKNIWVKTGGVNLRYDVQGSLQGLKLNSILTPEQVQASAIHNYIGGSNGSYSNDGNFNSAQTGGLQSIYSEQIFSNPQTLTKVIYRIAAEAWSGDGGGNGSTAWSVVQFKDATTGEWNNIPGTLLFDTHYNDGGGGTTGHATSANPASFEITVSNVIGVRAGTGAGAFGGAGGYVAIYELQYDLADQSFLGFDEASPSFKGHNQTIAYDPMAHPLTAPYFEEINPNISQSSPSWLAVTQESILESQMVVGQEYSADGVMETQIKADQTVTVFDNNKPKVVLDEAGEILIEYSYDADGHPTRVYLKNARDTLPDEVQKARQGIEEQRAASLEALAKQKNLVYQEIKSNADTNKNVYKELLTYYQNQYQSASGSGVKGKAARLQLAAALGSLNGTINEIYGFLADVSRSEADAYAALDSQVKSVSDKIEADSQTAFTELSNQEANLKKEILRQEVSPIVYDHYRRILGRDPSSAEYDYWISKTDYNSGAGIGETNVLIGQNVDPKTLAFQESSGQAFIEAESYLLNQPGTSSKTWQEVPQDSLFSGSRALLAGPETNASINSSIVTASPRLDYKVNFSTAGTYYLWVRGYCTDWGSDSIHAGLNGVLTPTTTNMGYGFASPGFSWTGKNSTQQRAAFTITAAGEYTINFWMREDGFRFDKFILTKDSSFVPSGISLQESSRVPAPPTIVSKKLTEALKDHLNALPELQERQAYVVAIKQNVTSQINSFLAMSGSQKQSFASGLGLSAPDLINLSSSDAQKILTWLNGRSLHFGQSAFLALESLLDQKGISYTRTDLATKTILVDILTGVISPLDDGDLVLSVFALNKVAGLYGLDLSGANLTWEDLQKVYSANIPASTIRFDGSGDYLSAADSDDWDFGTGEFTIDFRVKFNSVASSQTFFGNDDGSGNGLLAYYNNASQRMVVVAQGNEIANWAWSPSVNTWYHIAVLRYGTGTNYQFGVWVNGQVLNSDPNSTNIAGSNSTFRIGHHPAAGGGYLDGSINEFRVSKGIARWKSDFTPPTQSLTADSYTKLLLSDPGLGIKDSSAAVRPMTVFGDTKVDTSALVQAASQRIIAHINGNHYVVITAVTDTSITYIDPGIGADKHNETLTVTKAGFMKAWDGNVTLETQKLQTVANYQTKVLSATQAQSVRGAFWGSILGLIGSILVWIPFLNPLGLALTAISAVVSGIEGDWISAISSIVTLGIAPNGLGGFFKDVFHGVTNALGSLGTVFNAVGGFVSNVYSAVVGFAGNVSSGIGGFLHGALGVSSKIAANIASTAVSVGLNYGVAKGFEILGVNPQLSSFFGSLAAGAIIGGFKPLDATKGITQAVNIQQSVSNVITLTNVGRLGLELGLDNSFTNIIGLSLAAVQGSFIDKTVSSLSAAFANIKPQLVSSLSLYGLDKLGGSLGLPGGIASVAAAPILGVLQNGSAVGTNLIASIQEGLTNAAIGYGIHFATGSISNPLLGSLASRALAGAIEGALFTGNIFSGLFDAAKKSVLDLFGANKQQLLSNVTDLSVLISQKGSLSAALEAYGVQIFDRGTIESVVRSGGFTSALLSPKQNILLPTGVMGKESILSNGTSVLFDTQGSFIGFKRQGVIELGTFGITDTGKFGLKNGQLYGTIQTGNTYSGSVKDGQAITLTIAVGNNEIKIAGKDNSSVVFDQTGQIVDGYIDLGKNAYNFVVNAGNLSDIFVSTAEAAQFTIVAPDGNVVPVSPLNLPNPGVITQTKTRARGQGPQYLVRFLTQDKYDELQRQNDILSANTQGKIYTTDILLPNDANPEYAAATLQLGNDVTGRIDPARAKYFVVFDTDELIPTAPTPSPVVKQFSGYENLLPTGPTTNRNEVVFNDRPFINLNEITNFGKRLIYKGVTGFLGIVNAFISMISRGINVES